MRSIACIFAHPDDETFAIGGTLAKYAAAGVRIDLYCATNGDAGKTSGLAIDSRQALADRRNEELQTAARMLGVSDVVTPGHKDGALAAADQEAFVGEIVAFIRARRPAVVITFGPEGAPTGHPDHRAISRATTAAFHLAALPTEYPEAGPAHAAARLYYVAWSGEQVPPGKPPRRSVPPTARVDVRQWLRAKRDAFRAHQSQSVHEPTFELLATADHEDYALAAGVRQPSEMVDDLFAGLA